MKQVYYITFMGRYEIDGRLSKRRESFSIKDTCTDFVAGNVLIYKGRYFHVEEVTYETIEGAFR